MREPFKRIEFSKLYELFSQSDVIRLAVLTSGHCEGSACTAGFYIASSTPRAREAYLDLGSLALDGRMIGALVPTTMPALEEWSR